MRALLEHMQSDFAAALIDVRNTPAILPSLAVNDPRALDRLALYRSNLTATWQQALANAYPVVRALVGEEFFVSLARAYGRAHCSISGDLNLFGAQFAGFVAAFERSRSLPYLADVAALEWLVHRAHYAADAAPMPRARIAALSPHDLLAATFALQPACACLDSRFPVASLWLAHQPQASIALPESLARREFALVVRPRWHVQVLASSAGEVAALTQLRAGATMDGAIDAALLAQPDFDFSRALVRWFDYAVLTISQPAGSSARTA